MKLTEQNGWKSVCVSCDSLSNGDVYYLPVLTHTHMHTYNTHKPLLLGLQVVSTLGPEALQLSLPGLCGAGGPAWACQEPCPWWESGGHQSSTCSPAPSWELGQPPCLVGQRPQVRGPRGFRTWSRNLQSQGGRSSSSGVSGRQLGAHL